MKLSHNCLWMYIINDGLKGLQMMDNLRENKKYREFKTGTCDGNAWGQKIGK